MKIIVDTSIFASALAIDHIYPLYTLDKKLADAAQEEGVLFQITKAK